MIPKGITINVSQTLFQNLHKNRIPILILLGNLFPGMDLKNLTQMSPYFNDSYIKPNKNQLVLGFKI